MRDLPAFLFRHALIGFGIGAAFIAFLLWRDAGGLGGLIIQSDAGLIAGGVLVFAVGSTFAAVQMSMAAMLAGRDDENGRSDDHRAGRTAAASMTLAPVRTSSRP
ncbi:MAG: hypothetical protein AAFR11_04515 [Pseudomonadota bacterium]